MHLHGIIPLYKPKGYTSHDCVIKLRRLLRQKRIGHTGTLDPEVEGVLPICVGEATKVIPYLSEHKKVYVAKITLGKATTTEDAFGDVVEEKEVTIAPNDDEIARVLQLFVGEIIQIPPMYSAVKVKGKRLYEYAREGIDVERPKRTVTIYDIKRLDDVTETRNNAFRFQVTCSKGTYIRTLCVDIGKKLGYPAHMSFLKRIESDTFQLDETVTLEEISERVEQNSIDTLIYPLDRALIHFDRYDIPETSKEQVFNGQILTLDGKKPHTTYVRVYAEDKFLAIYKMSDQGEKVLKPVRIFNLHRS